MIRKPNINVGGQFGAELNKLWDALVTLNPSGGPGVKVSHTTYGVTIEAKSQASSSSGFTFLYIQSETQQWLKCQTPSQVDTANYTWVAKPHALRCDAPPTADNYASLEWGSPFTGERHIYRSPNERLRLFSRDTAGISQMELVAATSLYESWSDGTIYDDITDYLTNHKPASKIGLIDYLYEFQVLYPTYSYGLDGPAVNRPQEGFTRATYAIPLDREDLPTEVPDDASFAAASTFYLDLNMSGRRWLPKHFIQPTVLEVISERGTAVTRALPVWEQQYVDQKHGNAAPSIKTLLPLFWPELQS